MENEQNLNSQEENENAISQEDLQREIEQLKLQQNLPFGIIAGLVAASVMALLWAVITVVTMYQIGYMAIAVGFAVGFAVRFAGKGIDKIFGIMGAVLAFFGCILGNFFSQVAFLADYFDTTYSDILSIAFSDFSVITEIMVESFHPMDVLFYGIAIYAGYRYSFRTVED